MAVTGVRSEQVNNGEIKRDDLNTAEAGQAVTRKIIAGAGASISSTGVDTGTGDVTISASASILNDSEPFDMESSPGSAPEKFSGNLLIFQFRNNFDDECSGNSDMPREIDLAVDPVLRFNCAIHQAGSGNADVRIMLEIQYLSDGENTGDAADETLLQTVPVIDNVGEIGSFFFTLDGTLMSQDARVVILLSRLGSDVLDTFTGDIGIAEVARWDFRRQAT